MIEFGSAMDTLFATIRYAIVLLAVSAAMALFRKLLPAAKTFPRDLSSPDLEDRFMPLRSRIITVMLAIAMVFFLATWQGLEALNRYFAGLGGTAEFSVLPQSAIWFFLPGFGAICLCWELTLQAWALFSNRTTVNLFSDWTNQSPMFWGRFSYPGMDSRKALRWLTLIVVVPIAAFTALALNMHTTFDQAEIRECGYAFKPCRVFQYSDIRRLVLVDGRISSKGIFLRWPQVVLEFPQGYRWSSAEWEDSDKATTIRLEQFLIGKTRVPIEEAQTEQSIPRSPGN